VTNADTVVNIYFCALINQCKIILICVLYEWCVVFIADMSLKPGTGFGGLLKESRFGWLA